MITDPIADMVTRIRNGYLARKSSVVVPHSKLKQAVALVLSKNGYIGAVKTTEENARKMLEITLQYKGKEPALSAVKRISKPGYRRYSGYRSIPLVAGGLGMIVISTPQGVITGQQARKQKIGGEILCEVW